MSEPDDKPLNAWSDRKPEHDFEEFALEIARTLFEERGEVTPHFCYCRVNRDFVTQELKGWALRVDLFGTQASEAVRESLADSGHRGVAALAETWSTDVFAGPKSHSEERYESVTVAVEHYDLDGGRRRQWRARIDRSTGKAVLGEWQFFDGSPMLDRRQREVRYLPRRADAPAPKTHHGTN